MTTPPTTGVDVMQEVLQALGACEGGQSVDLDALRQRVQGVAADIWDLEKRLPDLDDKYAVF